MVSGCGHTYERSALLRHLRNNQSCPHCRRAIPDASYLAPNAFMMREMGIAGGQPQAVPRDANAPPDVGAALLAIRKKVTQKKASAKSALRRNSQRKERHVQALITANNSRNAFAARLKDGNQLMTQADRRKMLEIISNNTELVETLLSKTKDMKTEKKEIDEAGQARQALEVKWTAVIREEQRLAQTDQSILASGNTELVEDIDVLMPPVDQEQEDASYVPPGLEGYINADPTPEEVEDDTAPMEGSADLLMLAYNQKYFWRDEDEDDDATASAALPAAPQPPADLPEPEPEPEPEPDGKKDTDVQVLAHALVERMKLDEINVLLGQHQLPVEGNKADKLARLLPCVTVQSVLRVVNP
jgi:hypothetical protein